MDEVLERRSKFWFRYLRQDGLWIPRDKVPVRVDDMDIFWRQNAAKWLERRAPTIELFYTFGELCILGEPIPIAIGQTKDGEPIEIDGARWGIESNLLPGGDAAQDAFDRELDQRGEDPIAWLKTTPLYKALAERYD